MERLGLVVGAVMVVVAVTLALNATPVVVIVGGVGALFASLSLAELIRPSSGLGPLDRDQAG